MGGGGKKNDVSPSPSGKRGGKMKGGGKMMMMMMMMKKKKMNTPAARRSLFENFDSLDMNDPPDDDIISTWRNIWDNWLPSWGKLEQSDDKGPVREEMKQESDISTWTDVRDQRRQLPGPKPSPNNTGKAGKMMMSKRRRKRVGHSTGKTGKTGKKGKTGKGGKGSFTHAPVSLTN